jgi:hypothetical protein
MQTIIKLFLIITMLCFSISQALAQESTLRLISLSGDTLNACRIDSLSDIVLFASCSGKAISIPIDSIAILERFKEGHFLKGAAIGTLVGGTVGAIIGYATYQKPEPRPNGLFTIDLGPGPAALGGGLIGGVGGFVVGGIIGSSSDHYKIDLRTQKTLRMKRLIIQQVFVN